MFYPDPSHLSTSVSTSSHPVTFLFQLLQTAQELDPSCNLEQKLQFWFSPWPIVRLPWGKFPKFRWHCHPCVVPLNPESRTDKSQIPVSFNHFTGDSTTQLGLKITRQIIASNSWGKKISGGKSQTSVVISSTYSWKASCRAGAFVSVPELKEGRH